MPEGPEVNVIKDGVNHYLKNNFIVDVNLPEGSKFLKKKPDGYDDFKLSLPLKVIDVKSKGKLIYFIFENNWILMCRLLMSGGWFLEKASKHNHFEMIYKNKLSNEKTNSIWFVDPRHFGTLKWTNDKSVLNKALDEIGPDFLNDEIKSDEFLSKMKNKKNGHKTIATVFMDQSVFSGIGNYLKSEILYQARVSPHSVITNIPDEKLIEILSIIKQKIRESYLAGGASIRHYSDIKKQEGKYSFRFEVYQKKVDSLGHKIIMEKTKDGRTTHWVKEVQELF